MKNDEFWTNQIKNTTSFTKQILSRLSIKERSHTFRIFLKLLKPNKKSKVLDVGVTSLSIYPDSNLFEKLYPYPKNLTAATIESKPILQKLFPNIKVVKIIPHKKLPFKDNQFDIAVSWATLEHVGDYKDQEFFLNELLRVSKKIFVTTPYRGCIYEPHTGLFFFHWLPLSIFRKICLLTGKSDWAQPSVLNPLYISDLNKLNLKKKISVRIYNMFYILRTHLIITNS